MTDHIDLRGFVSWVVDEFEPACRVDDAPGAYGRAPGAGRVELYGAADLACILWSLRHLRVDDASRAGWFEVFDSFQDPLSGAFHEAGSATHGELHASAFLLGAMELLDLAPSNRLRFADQLRRREALGDFLDGLDWREHTYLASHDGAGLASVFALVPSLYTSVWFDHWFEALEARLDPASGLFGVDKPASGDLDQIGGTFHYAFVYEHFNRHLAHPEARIESVLGLQADGIWDPDNPLWLTLDAVYLLSRASRRSPGADERVREAVRRAVRFVADEVDRASGRDAWFVDHPLGAHHLTAAVSLFAEAQSFLGADEVRTDRPLRLVLDRRPFV